LVARGFLFYCENLNVRATQGITGVRRDTAKNLRGACRNGCIIANRPAAGACGRGPGRPGIDAPGRGAGACALRV